MHEVFCRFLRTRRSSLTRIVLGCLLVLAVARPIFGQSASAVVGQAMLPEQSVAEALPDAPTPAPEQQPITSQPLTEIQLAQATIPSHDAPPPAQNRPSPAEVISNLLSIPRRISVPFTPISFRDQTRLYRKQTFDLASFLWCTYPAAIDMALPPTHYPKDWKDGGAAYARNYGDVVATHVAAQTGKYLSAALFREDPRYFRSISTNPLVRSMYAIGFTLVDRSRTGNVRPAFANIAGVLAGGYVGRLYLPTGYNDGVHARHRALGLIDGELSIPVVGTTTSNLIEEFRPELHHLARKLHLPFGQGLTRDEPSGAVDRFKWIR